MCIDLSALTAAYADRRPDPADPTQRVAFGTSGHRGSALDTTFNEDHILATTQAVVDWRAAHGVDGPLFLGRDTHALSEPAWITAREVLAGNGVDVRIDAGGGFTPTPGVSHAVVAHNRGRTAHLADGIVVTPSHNPPRDGGFKYNGPDGGPADTGITGWIEARANALLAEGLTGVRRAAAGRVPFDFVAGYVEDLPSVVDVAAIAAAGVRIGVDPLGGASVAWWPRIAERFGLDLTVVNEAVDPAFAFMPPDWDGKIRMDCSSPHAMAGLIGMKDRFDLAVGNDPDADRHGIVTPAGLMNPNHYLAAAIDWLLESRDRWNPAAAIGKTAVTSALVDRVAAARGRAVFETPVGLKWFVAGLSAGDLAFAGEESAGATFVRFDGTVWTTDKDGILLGLLAAEMTAKGGEDPHARYRRLTATLGEPFYARTDAPATAAQKAAFKALDPATMPATLAGDPVTRVETRARGNDAPLGGVKVSSERGWFAARPSGTEDVVKVYAESFVGAEHLAAVQADAQAVLAALTP